jgi:peptidoglycan lytic transglycosylase
LIYLFVLLFCADAFSAFVPAVAAKSSSDNPPSTKSVAKKSPKSVHKTAAASSRRSRKKRHRTSPHLRRMHLAFIASSSLQPMARQLLQDPTPAAYAGVESYARHHSKEDAGALAWLVLGYAHILNGDYAKAIDPLKRASRDAGDFGDYVAFYLGTAYYQTGKPDDAIAIFNKFATNYPNSLLIRDVRIAYARALISQNKAQDAVALLEKDRAPIRSDQELVLGKAYEAVGDNSKAVEIFRNLYFHLPLSLEAPLAQTELSKLSASTKYVPTVEERKVRADLLFNSRQYDQAAGEYQSLLGSLSPQEQPVTQLKMAVSWYHLNRDKDAKKILDALNNLPPELAAERLYYLGEIAQDSNDENGFLSILEQLRQSAPTSHWFELALLSAGNMYLLKPDFDKAIDYYRELHVRFPQSNLAAYAHWKVAWLSLQQGRDDEAKKEFENQIALYPTSPQVPAALYWRARLAEEDKQPAVARAYYQKIAERFPNYYYGELASKRLAKLPQDDDPVSIALLDHVPALNFPKIADAEIPDDNLRVQKAELLDNGALVDFAIRELQAAEDEDKGTWYPVEAAKLYQRAGRYDLAIETLKHAVPNYFALDLSSLPRSYWQALFPKAYWPQVRKFAAANHLDPYLVASLIRQESEFNPNAISRANAVGLMQLLPSVGRKVAKQERIRHFHPQQLLTPAINLRLGSRYFSDMVNKFGSFEYALAAYNAGDNRVNAWLGLSKYRDSTEFVEAIPFSETREYVEAIMRNAYVYRQLYGKP